MGNAVMKLVLCNMSCLVDCGVVLCHSGHV